MFVPAAYELPRATYRLASTTTVGAIVVVTGASGAVVVASTASVVGAAEGSVVVDWVGSTDVSGSEVSAGAVVDEDTLFVAGDGVGRLVAPAGCARRECDQSDQRE